MKRAVFCVAVWIASSAYGVVANAVALPDLVRHEVIRKGDSALGLAMRSGLSAGQFTAWLQKADGPTRTLLTHLRPGDVFTIHLHVDDSIAGIRIERDNAGRKLAEQSTAHPATAGGLFAGVVGDAVTVVHSITGESDKQLAADQAAPVVTQLTPGRLFSEELVRRLGHRPVVAAVIDYAREKWHLPARLPKDSHCTLALLPSKASAYGMQLAYVEFDYRGRQQRVYHYIDVDGHDLMMGAHGEGYRIVDPLLPVSQARVSSGWGWRIQPVLGGYEFHEGIDYAAPLGTPVRATMDGVVAISDWRGNYGRLVEIKHANGLSTRYGHLNAFADRIRPGGQVHRGEVIGYVGASGLSTGPHLYYEVWDHGKRIDPTVHSKLMVVANLSTRERGRFRNYVDRMDTLVAP